MPDFDVTVTGDDELARALAATARNLDDAVGRQLVDEARMIARDAQSHVPRRSGAARATVEARVVNDAATIVGGGRTAPYFAWLEYGGNVGIRNSVRRPFVRDGRYIGRAVDAGLRDIEAAVARGVADASGGLVTGLD